jgi:hypothetical protein
MFKIRKKLKYLSEKLPTMEWPDIIGEFDLDERDLFNLNIGQRGNNLFLGFFSINGLQIVFEKYKIKKKLNKLGFNNLHLDIDTSDAYKHKVIVQNIKHGTIEKLIELVVRKDIIEINMPFECALNGNKYDVLTVEWLKMQNPRMVFSSKKPKLPGQEYPGLGIGSEALELIVMAARRLGLLGVVNIPDHFHNAYFYSKIFHYVNPKDQAKLMAIIRDTQGRHISNVAWAIERGLLIDKKKNQPFKWFIEKQVFPLTKEWRRLYNSKEYKEYVKKKQKKYHYEIQQIT